MTRRVAVVGCGFIGAGAMVPGSGVQSHAAAWSRLPDASLVALCDTDPVALRLATTRWRGAEAFSDLGRMLATANPEIVSVATPDPTHADVLDQVLATPSVRAILAEKPLALDVETAERVAATAAERGVLLAVNYVRRTAPSHRELARWLATDPIGPIELVRGCYVGGIKHNGTHWLDLVRFLVGEIESVRGFGPVDERAVDATIDVMLELESGARGLLSGIREAPYSLFEMELLGPGGRVRITDGGHRIEVLTAAPSPRFPGFRDLLPAVGPAGGLTDLLLHSAADLLDALRSGREPAARATDAIRALQLAQQALDGARTGGDRHAALGR